MCVYIYIYIYIRISLIMAANCLVPLHDSRLSDPIQKISVDSWLGAFRFPTMRGRAQAGSGTDDEGAFEDGNLRWVPSPFCLLPWLV